MRSRITGQEQRLIKNMKIDLVKKEDLEQVAEIYCNSFNSVSNEGWTKETALRLFEYWFNRQPDLFFIAKDKDKIIGSVVASAKPWFDGVRLQDGEVFVDPKYQKRGVGKQLLIKLIKEGINKYNTNTFEGITFAGAEFPLSWYKRIGMKKSDDLVVISGSCQEMLNNLQK